MSEHASNGSSEVRALFTSSVEKIEQRLGALEKAAEQRVGGIRTRAQELVAPWLKDWNESRSKARLDGVLAQGRNQVAAFRGKAESARMTAAERLAAARLSAVERLGLATRAQVEELSRRLDTLTQETEQRKTAAGGH